MRQYLPYLLVILLFPCIQKNLSAQEKFVTGELMIQLENLNATDSDVIKKLEQDFSNSNLKAIRLLSKRKKIWLFSFDENKTGNSDFLSLVKKHSMVDLAQFNHQLEPRELTEYFPNDTQFDDLWNLHNTGQTGGVEDADIDAPEAWGITTSGTTVLGDTIVVAIVDGGVDTTHEDLFMWRNYAEIPNNEIDDDGNGYVDDFWGWNAYDHNGSIPAYDHGTHVAGTAAAIGDNDMGVAGVHYNAQTMAIAASSTNESTVVEGLSYILEMRTLYNESNGTQGAFVVATNASFGVNYGDPDNYPIWEGLYVSLGEQGVLNVGATANKDWDIDVVGDVPTAFETDYMISVTNTKDNDVKHGLAGYGRTTIDIGAPGTNVYSTRPSNNYGKKTGCSMSAPHVCGSIAMLYAAADEELMELYKVDPAAVAIMMRKYILYNSDPNESLEGKTVFGRRLNLHQAILAMDDPIVDPSMVFEPEAIYHFMAIDRVDTSAYLIHNAGQGTINYQLEFGQNSDWLGAVDTMATIYSEQPGLMQLVFNSNGLDVGNYQTTLTINGTAGTLEIPVYLEVDLLDVNNPVAVPELKVNMHPNPFVDNLFMTMQGLDDAGANIQVFDLTGKLVMEQRAKTSTFIWDGTDRNGSFVPKGLYFIRVISGNDTATRKVIRE